MVPDNFSVQELVPKAFYERFGDKAIRYFDPRILEVLSVIRTHVDSPMTINNWSSRGGNRQWSGLRTPDSPWYSEGSAHSWGMAFDSVMAYDVDDLRREIISGELVLPHPVRLELGISWFHIDVMNISKNPVEAFYP
jgi:hypothetical protein